MAFETIYAVNHVSLSATEGTVNAAMFTYTVGHVMVFRSLVSGAPLRTEGIGMVTGTAPGAYIRRMTSYRPSPIS